MNLPELLSQGLLDEVQIILGPLICQDVSVMITDYLKIKVSEWLNDILGNQEGPAQRIVLLCSLGEKQLILHKKTSAVQSQERYAPTRQPL